MRVGLPGYRLSSDDSIVDLAMRNTPIRRRYSIGRASLERLECRLTPSVTLLSEDFQSTPPRTLPTSIDDSIAVTGPDAYVEVTGPGGRYPEPIGPVGNKSLVIDNPGPAQPLIAWSSEFSDNPAAFQSGTIAFDLYFGEPGSRDWTYLDVRFGYGGPDRTIPTAAVGDTTVWNSFRIHASAPDIVVDNGNGTPGGSSIQSLTRLKVEYTLTGATRSYRLAINGVPIDFGTGEFDRPWMAGAPGINMIALAGAFPQSSGLVFVDNLTVVQDDAAPTDWFPSANEPTDQLQWYQHRGNKRLTGAARVGEDILRGAGIRWSQFVGSRESWWELTTGQANSVSPAQILSHPVGDVGFSANQRREWRLGGPYVDLAGDGNLTEVSTGPLIRIGDFIPGNGVLEKLEGEVFDTTFGQGVVRLFVYQSGQWVQQWQSPLIPAMFATANLITGDFDDDGALEVALTPWNDIYILNMADGRVEQRATFKPNANESGRPYGWLGAINVDGDPRQEFVLMGDFQDFLAVMDWNGEGNLVKKWERVFDGRLSGKQTSHRPGAFPVIDVTGDGRPEIVTTVFNETGDRRWHMLVLNASDGSLVADLVDRAVDGTLDYDHDGQSELLTRHTQGAVLPSHSTLEWLEWQQERFHVRWSSAVSLNNVARFIQQPLPDFPAHINSATSTGKRTALIATSPVDGSHLFFANQLVDVAQGIDAISAMRTNTSGAIVRIAGAQGRSLDVLAARPIGADYRLLLQAERVGGDQRLAGDYQGDGWVDTADFTVWRDHSGSRVAPGTGADGNGDGMINIEDYHVWRSRLGATDPRKLYTSNLAGPVVQSRAGAPPRSSAVVGRMDGPSSAPTVVVQGPSSTVIGLLPSRDGSVQTSWLREGQGAFFGATQNQGQHEESGVALADVNGDDTLEVIYATVGETGQARLVAASSTGSEVWHADFNVSGGRRIFNEPGLVAWRTGHFTSPDHEDVLVQLMHGIGGTGEFVLLDGRLGTVLWTRTFGNTPGSSSIQRGAGESHLAVYDWDRDGLDEAINFNPDMFYVVDGNGINLIDRSVFNGGVFPGSSPLFGTPIIADFLGNRTDTILFAGSYAQLGLVTRTATPIWSTPFLFDNTPGFIQGIGDVDGDGDLDLLSPGHPLSPATYTASQFQAIDARSGNLLWTVPLPGRPHAPVGGAFGDTPTLSVSGDIDGDGRVESLFAIGDTLYVVGANASATAGAIEWSYRPDGGLLGSPILADADGDGHAEIIVVSTSGWVYGIGAVPPAPSLPRESHPAHLLLSNPKRSSIVDAFMAHWGKTISKTAGHAGEWQRTDWHWQKRRLVTRPGGR